MKQAAYKIATNAYGLYKFFRNVKFLSKDQFNNKSIAIVGAAGTAFKVERKDYLESFNYIVRINRAIISWKQEQERFVGKRTDILIHNFFENDTTGGAGALNTQLFDKFGLRLLIQPRFDYVGIRTIVNFYKKYKINYTVYTFSPWHYRKLKQRFGKHHPTRGFYSLYIALTANCSSVFVTGFTFFMTPYQGGYRSSQADVKSAKALIEKQGYHDPDLELELFLELIEDSPAKEIVLDEFLYDLVIGKKPELVDRVVLVE